MSSDEHGDSTFVTPNHETSTSHFQPDPAYADCDDTSQFLPGSLGGLSPSARGHTMKECEEQLSQLHKENFNLKLRIYFLEERLGHRGAGSGAGPGEVEALRAELADKQRLLCQAASAIDLVEGQHRDEVRRLEEGAAAVRADLEGRLLQLQKTSGERCQQLQEELAQRRQRAEQKSVGTQCSATEQAETLGHLTSELRAKEQQVAEQEQRIRGLEEALSEKQPEIQIKVQELRERDSIIEEKQNQLDQQNRVLVEIQITLAEKQRLIDALGSTIAARDARVAQLEAQLARGAEEGGRELSRARGENEMLKTQLKRMNRSREEREGTPGGRRRGGGTISPRNRSLIEEAIEGIWSAPALRRSEEKENVMKPGESERKVTEENYLRLEREHRKGCEVIQGFVTRVKHLSEENDAVRRDARRAESKMAELRLELKELRDSYNRAKWEARQLEADATGVPGTLADTGADTTQEENERLWAEVEDKNKKLAQLSLEMEKQVQTLLASLKEKESQLLSSETRLASSQVELAAQEKRVKELEEKLSQLQGRVCSNVTNNSTTFEVRNGDAEVGLKCSMLNLHGILDTKVWNKATVDELQDSLNLIFKKRDMEIFSLQHQVEFKDLQLKLYADKLTSRPDDLVQHLYLPQADMSKWSPEQQVTECDRLRGQLCAAEVAAITSKWSPQQQVSECDRLRGQLCAAEVAAITSKWSPQQQVSECDRLRGQLCAAEVAAITSKWSPQQQVSECDRLRGQLCAAEVAAITSKWSPEQQVSECDRLRGQLCAAEVAAITSKWSPEQQVTECDRLRGKLCAAEVARKNTANACGLLSGRLEELAGFLVSLLRHPERLGHLETNHCRFIRQAVQRSVDLSRQLSLSVCKPDEGQVTLPDVDLGVVGRYLDETSPSSHAATPDETSPTSHAATPDETSPTSHAATPDEAMRQQAGVVGRYLDETSPTSHAATPDEAMRQLAGVVGRYLDETSPTSHAATPDEAMRQLAGVVGRYLDETSPSSHAATPDETSPTSHAATPDETICQQAGVVARLRSQVDALKLEIRQRDIELQCLVQEHNLIKLSSPLFDLAEGRSFYCEDSTDRVALPDLSRSRLDHDASESETWSEPDRQISLARIGLPEERHHQAAQPGESSESSQETAREMGRSPGRRRGEVFRLHARLRGLEQVNEALRSELTILHQVSPCPASPSPDEHVPCPEIPDYPVTVPSHLLEQIRRQREKLESSLFHNDFIRRQLEEVFLSATGRVEPGRDRVADTTQDLVAVVEAKLRVAEERIAELEDKLSDAERCLASSREEAKRIGNLEEKLLEANQTLSALRDQAGELEARLSERDAEVKAKETSIARLEERVAWQKTEIERAAREMSELRAESERRMSEARLVLSSRVEEVEREMATFEKRSRDADTELKEAKTNLNEALLQRAEAEKIIEMMKAEFAAKTKALEEVQRGLETQIEKTKTMEEVQRGLETQIKKTKEESDQEMERRSKELEEAERQLEDLGREVERRVRAGGEAEAGLRRRAEVAEERGGELRRRVQESEKRYLDQAVALRGQRDEAALAASRAALERTRLANERLRLEQELRGAETRGTELEAELRGAERRLDQRLGAARRREAELERRVGELEVTNADLRSLLDRPSMGTHSLPRENGYMSGRVWGSEGRPRTPEQSGRSPLSSLVLQRGFGRQHSEFSDHLSEDQEFETVVTESYWITTVTGSRSAPEPGGANSPDLGIESDQGRLSSLEANADRRGSATADDGVDMSSSAVQRYRHGRSNHNCTAIEEKNVELRRELCKTRRALEETLAQLTASNQRKQNVEKAICKQLQKTNSILMKARGNLQLEHLMLCEDQS